MAKKKMHGRSHRKTVQSAGKKSSVRIAEVEAHLLQEASEDPALFEDCIRHARDVRCGAWPGLEHLLLEYAKDFAECEHAVRYVIQVTNERWRDLEPLLISDWDALKTYMKLLPIRGHWDYIEEVVLEGEHFACMDRANAMLSYCRHCRRKRWEQAEDKLIEFAKHDKHSMGFAVHYAKEFLDHHWQELEYAVLAGLCDPPATVMYATLTRDAHRWTELEDAVCAKPLDDKWARDIVIEYAVRVIKGRWEAGETHLRASAKHLLSYADRVIKGRLPPDLHDAMKAHLVLDVESTARLCADQYFKKYGP